jgi:hypothetical protein
MRGSLHNGRSLRNLTFVDIMARKNPAISSLVLRNYLKVSHTGPWTAGPRECLVG